MDLAALIGIAAGALLLVVAAGRAGSPMTFVDPVAFAFVALGTVAATMINYPLPRLLGALKAVRSVFARGQQDLRGLVQTLLEYAERARREGILALEPEAESAPDPFMRAGLSLVVDGTNPDDVREILETDLAAMDARQKMGAALFETMAQYAPAFGLVGTLIALVQMLQKLNDPSRIASGMAAALLATLYGVILGSVIFTPISGKLKVRAAEEALRHQLILEGLLAIQAGDTPAVLAQKLNSFLPPDQRVRRARVEDLYGDGEEG